MKYLKSRFAGASGFVAKGTVLGSGLLISAASYAAPVTIDVTDLLATLALAIITIVSVCTAAISIVVVIKVFKYVRAAF